MIYQLNEKRLWSLNDLVYDLARQFCMMALWITFQQTEIYDVSKILFAKWFKSWHRNYCNFLQTTKQGLSSADRDSEGIKLWKKKYYHIQSDSIVTRCLRSPKVPKVIFILPNIIDYMNIIIPIKWPNRDE